MSRRKRKTKFQKKLNQIIFLVLLIYFIITIGPKELFQSFYSDLNQLTNSSSEYNQINNEVISNIHDEIYYELYFTYSNTNITQIIVNKFKESNIIKCSFYEINKKEILDILEIKQSKNKSNIKLIIDNNNFDELEHHNIEFQMDSSSKLMHNKFCLLDNNTILTGSLNPTDRGIDYNNNNLIFIQSQKIYEEYEKEFLEMENNIYHKGEKSKYQKIIDNNKNLSIEVHFCPEDNCQKQVLRYINNANKSINFMTFSFTDKEINNAILNKIKNGVLVKGIFEKTQAGSKYSNYNELVNYSIKDNNKYNMHHKVFIIDELVTITGSYNPSKNGNMNNDENMIIIENEYIAKQFTEEFNKLNK